MSHAISKIAWLLFFERAGDQRKEAKESRNTKYPR